MAHLRATSLRVDRFFEKSRLPMTALYLYTQCVYIIIYTKYVYSTDLSAARSHHNTYIIMMILHVYILYIIIL